MSEIHPFVHIGIGIIVTITSLLVDGMIIFAVAGLGFIGWGIFKLKKNNAKKPTNHQTHHNQAHTHTQSRYKICPNCKAIISKEYRFCPHCAYGV